MELRIRKWRVIEVEGGILVFCDPQREMLKLYEVPWPGRRTDEESSTRLEEELHGWVQAQLWDELEEEEEA